MFNVAGEIYIKHKILVLLIYEVSLSKYQEEWNTGHTDAKIVAISTMAKKQL